MTRSEEHKHREAVERLIVLFTEPNDSVDRGVLERIDDIAWRPPAAVGIAVLPRPRARRR